MFSNSSHKMFIGLEIYTVYINDTDRRKERLEKGENDTNRSRKKGKETPVKKKIYQPFSFCISASPVVCMNVSMNIE